MHRPTETVGASFRSAFSSNPAGRLSLFINRFANGGTVTSAPRVIGVDRETRVGRPTGAGGDRLDDCHIAGDVAGGMIGRYPVT